MEFITFNSPIYNEMKNKSIGVKIVLIGSEKSGKTTFATRISRGNYDLFSKESISPTIAMELASVLCKFNCHYYNLQIWDTSGDEQYRHITKEYYKHSDIIIIFYDSLTIKNFNDLKNYYDELNNDGKTIIGIVKNKYELDSDAYSNLGIVQNIPEEEIIEFAEKNKIVYGHAAPMLKYGSGCHEFLAKIFQEYINRGT